ncbi:beta-propeller domain-containing protein [Beggiatoa leptomitoformis]|uniref:Beta propeller domain-containing protein n=1 Tax=Beggiatoa leptomitoformis TaxID=288004 RepID=A0A2N9YJB7_9GAMM|nr:beta-propeller domain-containing protein [Beggiatoa leptomitoformis]ALG67466.1 hypothetical protein AL038_06800 [Beggiatoa leptomitoformis]AUI70316.1 hypothetical protein BLE401_17505 [Beggiatoa leptomitoformis]
MRFTRTLLFGALSLVVSMPSLAWQVSVEKQDDHSQVTVSNTEKFKNKTVYLTWVDVDTTATDMFLSWTVSDGWKKGLFPIADTPMDIEPFTTQALTDLDAICPDNHRCFVALVATKPNANPLDNTQWDATSILPLTTQAGYLRLPGQRFFLSPNIAIANTDTAGTTTSLPASEGLGTSSTEKPDIFKVIGKKVLYANAQAHKLQLIDISDPAQPRLTGELELAGTPREIYLFDDKIVLLQTVTTETGRTQVLVAQQNSSGGLEINTRLELDGSFLKSRRRNDTIYAITQIPKSLTSLTTCADCGSPVGLQLMALRFTNGTLEIVKRTELVGNSPNVAIFADHLVVTNFNSDNWQESLIQVYELDDAVNPLKALPALTIAGRIPSEFHVDVTNQQLRVVFGSPFNLSEAGSTLAIYALPSLQLLGKIDKIAPNESLFATRFTSDRAYIVTYKQQDPLWVIDLSDPSNPSILGKLEIPGWSEKLFFHDNLLLSIGIHDVPEIGETSQAVRRAALSLFDVSNPTKPQLINRLVPLVNQAAWSYSQALQDEQALLLNWDGALTALPIESWGNAVGSYLQIASLANKQLTDKGLVSSPVQLLRSTPIDTDKLVALGDQALLTIQWGTDKPKVLGELELATNIQWIKASTGQLFAGGYGKNGYSRFYQFSPTDLNKPTQRWSLPHGYNNISLDGKTAVFFNYSPLTVQTVNTENNVISPAWTLEQNLVQDDTPYWIERSTPFTQDGRFYLAEKRTYSPVSLADTTIKPDNTTTEAMQWQLHTWQLTGEKPTEATTFSIPGRPITFAGTQLLITQESTTNNRLLLNQVRLSADSAKLISSRELACAPYSQILVTTESLYIKCETPYNAEIYYPMTTTMADTASSEGSSTPVTEESPPQTQILKVSLQANFADEGSWIFEGYQKLQAAYADKVLIGDIWNYAYTDIMSSSSMPFYQSAVCTVYQLTANNKPTALKETECISGDAVSMTNNSLWFAKGFEGLVEVKLD